MRLRASGAAVAAVTLVVGAALGYGIAMVAPQPAARDTSGATPPGTSELASGQRGYLTEVALDSTRLLPPPPATGSLEDKHDREVFAATRSLKGTARWKLAQTDVDQSVEATLKDFSCAAGVELTPAAAPALVSLLNNATPDEMRVVTAAKTHFNRKRPFLVSPGEICMAKTADLVQSPDYPSGHATWGWMVGLMLAEIAPDRATEILVRARTYGESRIVCGAHNESAVTAGQINAAGLVAALHASPAFRGDMQAAQLELESIRRSGGSPPADRCALEQSALNEPLTR
jgi:acid phosphatase (class A)